MTKDRNNVDSQKVKDAKILWPYLYTKKKEASGSSCNLYGYNIAQGHL
jgi:hypothetical protein